MNKEIQAYIEAYDTSIQDKFLEIRSLIMMSTQTDIEERLWAKLPSFYVGNKFIRVIPFKDHLNIEASKNNSYKTELVGYKMTPKGMLQIYINQPVPSEVLKKIFIETLM